MNRLSEEQILMLEMSKDDIKNNHLRSQEDLDKMDMDWLNSLKLE